MIALEIKTEKNNLVPITKNIDLLKTCLQTGNVVLISDMYLDQKSIYGFLCNIDPVFQDIPIYVSQEYQRTKSILGGLYQTVWEKEGITKSVWTHYGDNYWSDYIMAKHFGIKAIWLKFVPLKKYEKLLIENNEDNIECQMEIGAALLTRLYAGEARTGYYDVGASFAGPILYRYIDWVLSQALYLGVKTLYFISRDGYYLKIIADKIIGDFNFDIKTKYLYGSRKSWRVPSNSSYDFLVDALLEQSKDLSIQSFCREFNVDRRILRAVIPSLKRLNIETLKTDTMKNLVVQSNEKKLHSLLLYLQQQINFEEKFAFVDVQGSGQSLNNLGLILDKKLHCYFFCGLTRPHQNQLHSQTFLPRVGNDIGWLELLTRAPEGQTIGFKEVSHVIVPTLGHFDCSWNFKDYEKGISSFTAQIISTLQNNDYQLKSFKPLFSYFRYFYEGLDTETAQILGSIPHSRNSDETDKEAAPEISAPSAVLAFFTGRWNASFPNLSVNRSSSFVLFLYQISMRLKKFRRSIIRIHIHKNKSIHLVVMGKEYWYSL